MLSESSWPEAYLGLLYTQRNELSSCFPDPSVGTQGVYYLKLPLLSRWRHLEHFARRRKTALVIFQGDAH